MSCREYVLMKSVLQFRRGKAYQLDNLSTKVMYELIFTSIWQVGLDPRILGNELYE